MTLLQEIIDGASGDGMPTSTLLRKCLVLGSKLDSQLVEQWVEWELNGYPKDVGVPDYRHLSMVIKVNMVDIAKRANGWVVPPEFLDENGKKFSEHEYRASVAEIEEYLSTNGGSLAFKVGNLVGYLMSQKFTDMNIVDAWCEVDRGRVKHILDSVRTKILKFALDIGKTFPEALQDESKMPQGSDDVRQIFNTNIYGPANVVGTANRSKVQMNVKVKDFSVVATALSECGVSETDVEELKTAMEAEPDLNGNSFGPMVSKWVGKMMRKAAEGSWAVGTGAAGNILADIINAYYGT